MAHVIKPMEDDLSFSVPLTPRLHQQAQEIAARQPSPERFKQAYLNVLAVMAMEQYFDCLGLASDVEKRRYQDPVWGLFSNAADLVLVGLGALDCCPVLEGASVCLLSPERWNGSEAADGVQRMGYVAVQLTADLRSAAPVGFLPQVSTSEIPLTDWQSLEVMLERLQPAVEALPQAVLPSEPQERPAIAPVSSLSNLSQWLQGEWDSHWQLLGTLMNWQQPQLSFRGNAQLDVLPTGLNSSALNRSLAGEEGSANVYTSLAKPLNLMLGEASQEPGSIALLVGIKAAQPTSLETYDILVKIFSVQTEQLLPPQLMVQVLDQDNNSVMQAEARQTSMIQLEFQGQVSECFSLKVNLGDFEQVEAFQI